MHDIVDKENNIQQGKHHLCTSIKAFWSANDCLPASTRSGGWFAAAGATAAADQTVDENVKEDDEDVNEDVPDVPYVDELDIRGDWHAHVDVVRERSQHWKGVAFIASSSVGIGL